MEMILEFYHRLIATPVEWLRWPMSAARMLMLFGILMVARYMAKTGRWFVAACLVVPILYYLDAAIVQSLGNVKRDTPTVVKTLVNLSWLGVLGYLYYGCRLVDRLMREGKLIYHEDGAKDGRP